MKHVYFLLSALLLFLCACSKDLDETESLGSIAGSVSDASTGEPVATVNVTLNPGGNSTVTGSDGSFTFRNLEPGEYTLEISKEEYKANYSKLYVKAGDATSAHLLIERIPAIVTADRETLDFGDNQSLNTMSFNIVNSSYEDLSWEIEERCEWITEVKPAKGTLAYGKTEGIVVVIDRDKLNGGENKAVIVIRSSNGSSQLNVLATGADHQLPSLNTLAVTDITSSTATFNGEIIDAGTPAYSERGFVYSLNSMPTIENTIAKLTSTMTSSKSFSYNAKELEYDKTYYIRAYAKNSNGIAYSSNEVKFTTPLTSPNVSTLAVDDADIDNGTATFRGEVTNVGIPPYTERGFVYSTYSNPTINDEKVIANGQGIEGTFSKYVTGLPKKNYYVRAYVTSASGTVYGKEIIIEMKKPSVATIGVDNINFAKGIATLKGEIKSIGIPPYTERGFVYSTSNNPTINDNKLVVSGRNEIGEYKVNASNLPTTTYYIRAYATNIAGTSYGNDFIVKADWIEIPSAGIAVQLQDIGFAPYESIKSMCENSTVGGFNDWRLPTLSELTVLYNLRESIGGFTTSIHNGGAYWSSTTANYGSHMTLLFLSGKQEACEDIYSQLGRAVRTLK